MRTDPTETRESWPRAAWRALAEEARALVAGTRGATLRALARERRPGLGLLLAAAAFLYYAWLGAGLAGGRYLERYNLAFDYDPSRYVLLWTADRSEWEEETHSPEYQVRHPFLAGLRPVLRPLAEAGIEPKLLCVLLMGACGAAGVLCAWLLLRAHGAGLPESLLGCALFAGSATQILHSIVVESYGPAALTLALVVLLTRLRLPRPEERARSRFLVGIAAFGVTITNLGAVLIAEAGTWLSRRPLRVAFLRTGAFACLLGLVLLVAAWAGGFMRVVESGGFDPLGVVRTARYAGHFQDDGPPVGPLRVATTLVAFGWVAPRFTEVPISDGTVMLDFRRFDYPAWVLPAVVAWLAVLTAGAAASCLRRETRWFGIVCVALVAFQLTTATLYQFRQSTFLSSSLPHFALFALLAEPARRVTLAAPRRRALVLALLALATAVIAANNHLRVADLVRTFAV